MHDQLVTLQRERKLEITLYDPFKLVFYNHKVTFREC